jgi:hypothetical protein
MTRRRLSALDLLADASQWRLLALLLSRPTPERKREVRQLVDERTEAGLAAAAHAWCDHAGEGAYLRLLGPGGLVPARAVAYRPFADPGWLLADLAGCHQAFAFRSGLDEPADHVAVLAELVSYLLLKEAYAFETRDRAAAQVTRAAIEHCLAEYLAPVARRMAERLDACGATDWAVAAHILAANVPSPPAERVRAEGEVAEQCENCGMTASPGPGWPASGTLA